MTETRNQIGSVFMTLLVVLSMVVGSAAFAGSAAAANVSDGDLIWSGQEVTYGDLPATEENSENEINNVIEIRDDSDDRSYLQQESTEAVEGEDKRKVTFDTDKMEAGSYQLIYEDAAGDEATVSFEIVEQDFSVTAEEADADDEYDVTFDSNRASYNVVIESDDLDNDEIEGLFGPESDSDIELTDVDDDDDKEYVIDGVSDERTADASELDEGDYNLTATVEDAGVSSEFSLSASGEVDGEATFEETFYSEEQGDRAEITVDLENTQTATVVIGNEDSVGYEYSFDVTDEDDDGEVTFLFDTNTAGTGAVPVELVEDSDDSISNADADTEVAGDALDAGHYDLSAQVSGTETDLASLSLSERSSIDANTHVIPKGQGDDLDAIANSSVASSTIAEDDTLVLQFEATGVYSYLDSASISDLKNDSEDKEMYVEATEQDPGPNADADKLDLSASNGELITDAENDTFYLVFNADNLEDTDGDSLSAEDNFEATFHVTENYKFVADEDDAEESSTSFTLAERDFEFDAEDDDDGRLVFPNDANTTISGDTTVAPGSEVNVVVRMAGENPILKSQPVEVSDDGSLAANFDLSDAEDGAEFTVQVGDLTGQTDAVIAGDQTGENSEENDSEENNTTSEFGLDVSVVDEDGSAVDSASVTVDGEAAGDNLTLENGTYTVTADADGYETATKTVTVDGDNASVTLTLAEEQPETTTDDPTTEDPTTDEPTSEDPAGSENNSSDDDTSSGPGQPGFGFGIAVVALAGAALLAHRRA